MSHTLNFNKCLTFIDKCHFKSTLLYKNEQCWQWAMVDIIA